MILFFLFTIVIAFCTTIFTTKTLVGYMSIPSWMKIVVLMIIFFCWLSPIVSMWLKKVYTNIPLVLHTSDVLYFLFGTVFILFSVLLIRDIIWYSGYWIGKFPDPKDLYLLNKMNLFALVFSFVLSFYSLYEGVKEPRIKDVNLYSSKIEEEFSIALITDWHINQGTTKEKIQNLIDRVNSLDVDVVLMVGDIIDDKVTVLGDKIDLLSGFTAKYGAYISFGNHELYQGLGTWRNKFNSIDNLRLLDNETFYLPLRNVTIVGIPDTRIFNVYPNFTPNFDKIMEHVENSSYKIIMSHAPDFAKELPTNMFDLQVSGHTHGGQIFPFHIPAKIENKFLAGLYDERGTKVYVSRGAGYWGPPVRFLAPSEITHIKIKPSY